MSLASDYAARVAASKNDANAVAASRPPDFADPGGTLQVTETGGMRIYPPPSANVIEVTAEVALNSAAWIVATYGG